MFGWGWLPFRIACLASAAPAAEAAPQGGIGGGFGGCLPKAPVFRFLTQFPVGKGQLRVELRTPRGVGELLQALPPQPAPLEGVAQIPGSGGAGVEPALGPRVINERTDLEALIPGGGEPADDFRARLLGRRRRDAPGELRDRGRRGRRRR